MNRVISDEGLMLKTSVFESLSQANLLIDLVVDNLLYSLQQVNSIIEKDTICKQIKNDLCDCKDNQLNNCVLFCWSLST